MLVKVLKAEIFTVHSSSAFSRAANPSSAMPSIALFHFTDAENFHFKFPSPRSGVEKKLVIISKPIEIAFCGIKMDFFKAGCWIDSKAAALQQTKAKINKRP